jgi:hypothetical protein
MDIFNGYDGRLFFDGQYETEDPYEILNNPFNQFNLFQQNTLSYQNEEESINEERFFFAPTNQLNNNAQPNGINENHQEVESHVSNKIHFIIESHVSNENHVIAKSQDSKKNDKITQGKIVTSTNTRTKTFEDTIVKKEKIKKIYNTKNMGCMKKSEKASYNNENKKVHDKYKPDNIRLKFKRGFHSYLVSFINILYAKSNKVKIKGKLQKLADHIVKNTKKEHILKMLDISARQYLSNEISIQTKKLGRNNNKILIDHIYEVNETSITVVLDKKIRELMNIFCSNDLIDDEIFKHFKRLHNYINDVLINKKNQDELYISEFKYQALNYEKEYKALAGRNE